MNFMRTINYRQATTCVKLHYAHIKKNRLVSLVVIIRPDGSITEKRIGKTAKNNR